MHEQYLLSGDFSGDYFRSGGSDLGVQLRNTGDFGGGSSGGGDLTSPDSDTSDFFLGPAVLSAVFVRDFLLRGLRGLELSPRCVLLS